MICTQKNLITTLKLINSLESLTEFSFLSSSGNLNILNGLPSLHAQLRIIIIFFVERNIVMQLEARMTVFIFRERGRDIGVAFFSMNEE